MMTNKMTVKGSDVLDMKLLTIKEAELLIERAEHMEGVVFWMKGQALRCIRNVIELGKSEYKDFKEYYNQKPVGILEEMSLSQAYRLMNAFEQVEVMIADGVPYDELPKTEHACRELRNGKEDRRADKAALRLRMEEAKEEAADAWASNPELAAEIVEDEHQQREMESKERQNEKFTKKPEFAHAVNDMNVGSQITEAGRDAERLNKNLIAIMQAAKAIGENGELPLTEWNLGHSLRYFAQLNQTLNNILNNK